VKIKALKRVRRFAAMAKSSEDERWNREVRSVRHTTWRPNMSTHETSSAVDGDGVEICVMAPRDLKMPLHAVVYNESVNRSEVGKTVHKRISWGLLLMSTNAMPPLFEIVSRVAKEIISVEAAMTTIPTI
jgi:hypothetical protein